MTSRTIEIDKYDQDGAFGLIIEADNQAPILLETEGADSSIESAIARAGRVFGRQPLRWCIVRLVPVRGNELLALDFVRLQSLNKSAGESK